MGKSRRGHYTRIGELTIAALLGLQLASCACEPGVDSREMTPEGRRGNVFTEHKFLTAAKATKRLGEDCTTYGASECLSELCLHYKHAPSEGYVCSRQCESDRDCPVDWNCVSTYPAPGSEFCVPPEDWVSSVAQERPPRTGRNRAAGGAQ